MLSLVVRDAGLALRDAAGGEVEQERLAVRARDADAHRVGAEPRVAAAPRRDDRPRDHVDEVQRHEPRLEALLGPVPDAAEVVRVAERDDAGAVLARTLDAERHRLAPDHLPVAGPAVEPQHRPGVEQDLRMLVDREPALEQRLHVARNHADAVRIVPREVCLDEVAGDEIRLAWRRAAFSDDG